LDERGFTRWLDELQMEWVHAARRLSPRLVVELLGSLGDQVADTVAMQDPSLVAAHVSWASAVPVRAWLDHAREPSERWIHRQQILQSLGRPGDLRPDVAVPVLDGLRWAYPYRLGPVRRAEGTSVAITVPGPEVTLRWNLVSDGEIWQFRPTVHGPFAAELWLTTDQAWRLLTNNFDSDRHGELVSSGDEEIVGTLLRTRAIIGTPE